MARANHSPCGEEESVQTHKKFTTYIYLFMGSSWVVSHIYNTHTSTHIYSIDPYCFGRNDGIIGTFAARYPNEIH
jgi:hypothetical protein